MSKKAEVYTAQFERKLISYQKTAFTLMLHPLVSAFVLVLSTFSFNLGDALRMSFSMFITLYWPNSIIWNSAISVGVLAITVAAVVFGVKGKLWCLEIAIGIQAIDFIWLFFLMGSVNWTVWILSLVLHLAFVVAAVFANIFYFQANAFLQKK